MDRYVKEGKFFSLRVSWTIILLEAVRLLSWGNAISGISLILLPERYSVCNLLASLMNRLMSSISFSSKLRYSV